VRKDELKDATTNLATMDAMDQQETMTPLSQPPLLPSPMVSEQEDRNSPQFSPTIETSAHGADSTPEAETPLSPPLSPEEEAVLIEELRESPFPLL
jgi:hypothetical protein